jgi:hypothetical protein
LCSTTVFGAFFGGSEAFAGFGCGGVAVDCPKTADGTASPNGASASPFAKTLLVTSPFFIVKFLSKTLQ